MSIFHRSCKTPGQSPTATENTAKSVRSSLIWRIKTEYHQDVSYIHAYEDPDPVRVEPADMANRNTFSFKNKIPSMDRDVSSIQQQQFSRVNSLNHRQVTAAVE
ncbi:unnamed protein product [Strongylus vulgaris]|uniref:Uncharacterized protein n=1 Tax=Strongylus vulgaris TaxID=40348 RepID=A0A3P7JIT1_STRVU|nr:unnamed protein product [Strongylus vulgaris]